MNTRDYVCLECKGEGRYSTGPEYNEFETCFYCEGTGVELDDYNFDTKPKLYKFGNRG